MRKDLILLPGFKGYGTLTEIGWEFEPIDFDDWCKYADALMALSDQYESAIQWAKGDALKKVPHGELAAACERLDLSYESGKQYRKTATVFEKCTRIHKLPFSHYRKVTYVEGTAERCRLLETARRDGLSGGKLGELVRGYRQKQLPPPARITGDPIEISSGPPDSQPNYNQSGRSRQEVTQGNDPFAGITDDETPDSTEGEDKPEWSREEVELWQKAQSGITVVANMRKGVHPNLIAAAKNEGRFVKIDRNSFWGNIFEIEKGDGDRDEFCDLFEILFWLKRSFQANIYQLMGGKVLCCWCHPQRCHGHFLTDVANGKITREEWTRDRLPELLRMYFPKDEKMGGAGDDTPN